MARFLNVILPVFLLLLVAACGAFPGNKQVDAGITHAVIKVCTQTDGAPYVCEAEIIDGKEKQNVALLIEHPAGWTVSYTADDVRAFDGQKIRGAVEEAISSDLRYAAPGIVERITQAIIRVMVP